MEGRTSSSTSSCSKPKLSISQLHCAKKKFHCTRLGSLKLPPCSKSIDSIWAWRILAYIVKNTKPNLKIKWWINRNRSSGFMGNDQWTTTNKLVTSLSWMEIGFYLAEKGLICRFWWMRRAPLTTIQWWFLIWWA